MKTLINNIADRISSVIALAEQGARVAPIKEALVASGHQYQFVRLVGMARRAVVTDVPMEIDWYPTVVGGRMSIFSVSNAKVGDIIDGYTVIYNKEVTGDGHMASYVTYIAIKM